MSPIIAFTTTRREFLQNGLTFVGLGLAMPTFLMQAAQAQANRPPSASPFGLDLPPIPGGKILVVIEMSGGNDGLNTVIPYTDGGYAKARPVIGVPSRDVVKLNSSVGLHPNMAALKPLYDKGQLAVITGVGYPDPNRSHFQSMDIWQTGNPRIDVRERTGWLARYFDDDGHFRGNPLSGITLGSALPLTLFSDDAPASVIGGGSDFGFKSDAPDHVQQMDTLRALYAQGTVAGSNAEFVRNVGSEAYSSSMELKRAFKDYDINAAAHAAKYPQSGLASGPANDLQADHRRGRHTGLLPQSRRLRYARQPAAPARRSFRGACRRTDGILRGFGDAGPGLRCHYDDVLRVWAACA